MIGREHSYMVFPDYASIYIIIYPGYTVTLPITYLSKDGLLSLLTLLKLQGGGLLIYLGYIVILAPPT